MSAVRAQRPCLRHQNGIAPTDCIHRNAQCVLHRRAVNGGRHVHARFQRAVFFQRHGHRIGGKAVCGGSRQRNPGHFSHVGFSRYRSGGNIHLLSHRHIADVQLVHIQGQLQSAQIINHAHRLAAFQHIPSFIGFGHDGALNGRLNGVIFQLVLCCVHRQLRAFHVVGGCGNLIFQFLAPQRQHRLSAGNRRTLRGVHCGYRAGNRRHQIALGFVGKGSVPGAAQTAHIGRCPLGIAQSAGILHRYRHVPGNHIARAHGVAAGNGRHRTGKGFKGPVQRDGGCLPYVKFLCVVRGKRHHQRHHAVVQYFSHRLPGGNALPGMNGQLRHGSGCLRLYIPHFLRAAVAPLRLIQAQLRLFNAVCGG